MLGWQVSVYRQRDGGAGPATADSPEGEKLAAWQSGWEGLRWIDALVKTGEAIEIEGGGYPSRYTLPVERFADAIANGLPGAHATWGRGPEDIVSDKWIGRSVVDDASIARCAPSEWLIVVAFDES